MHEIGAKRQLEQLAGQIGRGSHPRGRKAQLARISLHEFGELLDALDLQRRTRDQHVRRIGRKSYRDEVLGLVLWDVGIKARIDHEARRDECEGMPSGAARAAARMPRLPPAPATFSTKNCLPERSPSFCVSNRATMSAGPPGANGTITRTGRVG